MHFFYTRPSGRTLRHHQPLDPEGTPNTFDALANQGGITLMTHLSFLFHPFISTLKFPYRHLKTRSPPMEPPHCLFTPTLFFCNPSVPLSRGWVKRGAQNSRELHVHLPLLCSCCDLLAVHGISCFCFNITRSPVYISLLVSRQIDGLENNGNNFLHVKCVEIKQIIKYLSYCMRA